MEKKIENTYVLVKPGFANNSKVVDEIKRRILALGLEITEKALVRYDIKSAQQHYAEHIGKSFYPELEKYITSDTCVAMVVSGENAVAKVRAIAGSTRDPQKGTIRYDIPKMLHQRPRVTENVVHSSDSPEAACREIEIYNNFKCVDIEL